MFLRKSGAGAALPTRMPIKANVSKPEPGISSCRRSRTFRPGWRAGTRRWRRRRIPGALVQRTGQQFHLCLPAAVPAFFQHLCGRTQGRQAGRLYFGLPQARQRRHPVRLAGGGVRGVPSPRHRCRDAAPTSASQTLAPGALSGSHRVARQHSFAQAVFRPGRRGGRTLRNQH